MGPKVKEEPPKLTRKQREALAAELALKRAGEEAKRLYAQQDKLRTAAERVARAQHDEERFDRAAEVKRLNEEMASFRAVGDEIVVARRLALLEHSKLAGWRDIAECSWLPHPNSEPDIHAFLTQWRDEQVGIAELVSGHDTHAASNCDTRVWLKRLPQPPGAKEGFVTGSILSQRDDSATPAEARRATLDHHLAVCVQAVQLARNIQAAADECAMRNKAPLVEMHTRHQIEIFEALLETLDSVTCVVLSHLDVFFDQDEEAMLRLAPSDTSNPAVRFGLWMRNSEKSRVNVSAIRYPELGIVIEPKDPQTLKLPRALGLQHRDNVVIRAMQFSFDPLSVLTPAGAGQEYYALDCVVVLESLTCPDRPKRVAEWTCRVEAAGGPRELHRNEYPPKNTDKAGGDKPGAGGGAGGGASAAAAAAAAASGVQGGGDSEYTIKVTIEVPETVALRTRQPIIGRWNPATRLWDPCSTGRLGPDALSRKVSFLTSDLTALALVHEKGFDVPYERWQLVPHGIDQVLYIVEGRHREDTSARGVELRIVVREQECCLLGPDERELAHIRGRWMPPLTLLRLLSKAGYNFCLNDADAEFIPSVLPRTNALETKAYFDMALFCMTHSFSSTRHNRTVEDADTGLFRVSKDHRPFDHDQPFPVDADEQGLWHSVRYEAERAVVAEFTEEEEVPALRAVAGHVSHLNLYTVLQKIYGADEVHFRATASNPLVQDCVLNLLLLTRPLTWG